jgi:hypothetical protein
VAAIHRLYRWAAWRPVTHLSNAQDHLAAMISGRNKECPGGGSNEWHG